MINGLFEEISEEEIMSVNGGCGGGCNPYAAPMPCQECIDKGNAYAKTVVISTVIGAATGGVSGAIGAFATAVLTGVPEPHSAHAH